MTDSLYKETDTNWKTESEKSRKSKDAIPTLLNW